MDELNELQKRYVEARLAGLSSKELYEMFGKVIFDLNKDKDCEKAILTETGRDRLQKHRDKIERYERHQHLRRLAYEAAIDLLESGPAMAKGPVIAKLLGPDLDYFKRVNENMADKEVPTDTGEGKVGLIINKPKANAGN